MSPSSIADQPFHPLYARTPAGLRGHFIKVRLYDAASQAAWVENSAPAVWDALTAGIASAAAARQAAAS